MTDLQEAVEIVKDIIPNVQGLQGYQINALAELLSLATLFIEAGKGMPGRKKKLTHLAHYVPLRTHAEHYSQCTACKDEGFNDCLDLCVAHLAAQCEVCPFIPDKYKHIQRGQIWINDRDYEVEVLDLGEHELWLRYLPNNQRCAWEYEKFLEQYKLTSERNC